MSINSQNCRMELCSKVQSQTWPFWTVSGWLARSTVLPTTCAGQVSESPVANVVDPNYTFIAKVRKSYLPLAAVYGGIHRRIREMGQAYLAGQM